MTSELLPNWGVGKTVFTDVESFYVVAFLRVGREVPRLDVCSAKNHSVYVLHFGSLKLKKKL